MHTYEVIVTGSYFVEAEDLADAEAIVAEDNINLEWASVTVDIKYITTRPADAGQKEPT